jgi:hypothetical protein
MTFKDRITVIIVGTLILGFGYIRIFLRIRYNKEKDIMIQEAKKDFEEKQNQENNTNDIK